MEIKLFGVARGSLYELLNDYEDYMRTRQISFWDLNNERFRRINEVCRWHNDTAFYTSLIHKMNDEEYCNLMLTLIHQIIAMLDKMIEKVKGDFLRNGGIKEQMFKARQNHRNNHS